MSDSQRTVWSSVQLGPVVLALPADEDHEWHRVSRVVCIFLLVLGTCMHLTEPHPE